MSFYVPVAYILIDVSYFIGLQNNAVKIGGICLCINSALVSLSPPPLFLFQFLKSCSKVSFNAKAKELEEIQNNYELHNLQSREKEQIDPKDHIKNVISSFNDLTSAWSPMIAVMFASEFVVLISAGFALSNTDEDTFSIRDLDYIHVRDLFMSVMIGYCILLFLSVSWIAEETHKIIQKFGSAVR